MDESTGGHDGTRTTADRVGLIVLAVVLWAIAAWMFWIVRKFAGGDDWWDFAVHLVLEELIFAIGLLGLALVAHALFPRATGKLVEKAMQKAGFVAFAILGLFFASLVVVALVGFVLTQFDLMR